MIDYEKYKCLECNGHGDKIIYKSIVKKYCSNCEGTGRVDWVDNVFENKSKESDETDDIRLIIEKTIYDLQSFCYKKGINLKVDFSYIHNDYNKFLSPFEWRK